MEKVRPWWGQLSDLVRIKNRTELFALIWVVKRIYCSHVLGAKSFMFGGYLCHLWQFPCPLSPA